MLTPFTKPLAGKTFIDLFSGIGGFRLALESLGAACVYSCDNDKFACETYEVNFGDDPMGDITAVDAPDVPDHDILCAGFPCVAFSIAGKRRGFLDETHGTLFFDVARIIAAKKPEVVFLENVRNFASHDGGRTLETVRRTMGGLGYSFHWRMLPSNLYGAATKRERVYMVCFREDLGVSSFEFPEPVLRRTRVCDIALPAGDPGVANLWIDRSDMTWLRDDVEAFSENPLRLGYVADGSQGYRIYSAHGPAVTISATGGGVFRKTGGYLIDGRVRPLAAREAARAMGFPDWFVLHSRESQALKQLGNAVVVDVIQRIAMSIGGVLRPPVDSSTELPIAA